MNTSGINLTIMPYHGIIKLNILEVNEMKWEDVRQAFPEQWVLIEAVHAYTNEQNERILEEIIPLEKFPNSPEAMKAYKEIHRKNPDRELYVIHTSRNNPNILEKKWAGVRR